MNLVLKKSAAVTVLVLSSAIMADTARAAEIDFVGQAQSANLTTIPHVLGATMWGSIETGSGMGVSATGLSSLDGLDLSKFTYTYGDLELTSYESPTLTTPGFQVFSEGDSSLQPIRFFYDGNEWAVGTLNYIRVDVDSVIDTTAVGSATANLTTAGTADDTFFNEVMLLTGGSGLLTFSVDSYFPVDNSGNFSTTGTIFISSVPEADTYAMMFAGLGLLAFVARRKT